MPKLINELKQMSKDDLNKKMEDFRKELMKLNAQIASGTTPKSPGQVKNLKKNIAKIHTILKTKEVIKKNE